MTFHLSRLYLVYSSIPPSIVSAYSGRLATTAVPLVSTITTVPPACQAPYLLPFILGKSTSEVQHILQLHEFHENKKEKIIVMFYLFSCGI